MQTKKIIQLVALAIVMSPAHSAPESQLAVRTTTATAIINEVAAGRRLIALPELSYEFAIDLQCAGETQAESISISVADTRHTLGAAEIAGQSTVEAGITIPRQQVAPIAIDNFCQLQEYEETAFAELMVDAAFTAHISLLCKGEEQLSIVYTTAGLALKLQCGQADDAAATTDQSESTVATER